MELQANKQKIDSINEVPAFDLVNFLVVFMQSSVIYLHLNENCFLV